jgi:hypothetical protein
MPITHWGTLAWKKTRFFSKTQRLRLGFVNDDVCPNNGILPIEKKFVTDFYPCGAMSAISEECKN